VRAPEPVCFPEPHSLEGSELALSSNALSDGSELGSTMERRLRSGLSSAQSLGHTQKRVPESSARLPEPQFSCQGLCRFSTKEVQCLSDDGAVNERARLG
jgi:hypothetical protein